MSEAVYTHRVQPCFVERPVKEAIQIPDFIGCADLCTEDQVIVVPFLTFNLTGGRLYSALFLKQLLHFCCEGNGAVSSI